MDLQDSDYVKLLNHIDDLKKICDKLQLDMSLLEIPIQKMLSDLESSSSESSESP